MSSREDNYFLFYSVRKIFNVKMARKYNVNNVAFAMLFFEGPKLKLKLKPDLSIRKVQHTAPTTTTTNIIPISLDKTNAFFSISLTPAMLVLENLRLPAVF